jgi:hypothetical protein
VLGGEEVTGSEERVVTGSEASATGSAAGPDWGREEQAARKRSKRTTENVRPR